ncbi:hypothetical protein OIE66_16585 [Nonomuraea sp. NBC_01738]|uniref:hypothetical protein n=1 Tax=Nonomuraea sp. NBC_01738 TaxID=2976003 RepID=UPI002E11414C|nr:hypothetical protein OIE66_16585 [Nonomuraea sp. NBC_01738]
MKIIALASLTLIAATGLVVAPAQAATTAATACPVATKAEAAAKLDKPARGATAIKGVRVGYLPKGFAHGQVVVNKGRGVTEYGYQWSDDRDDVDSKHRSLWVRVVCWPKAKTLTQLKGIPVDQGTFSGDTKIETIGGRKVLVQEGDGALGHGRYVGWVERKGVVVTVMASRPLVRSLDKIVKGVRLPG